MNDFKNISKLIFGQLEYFENINRSKKKMIVHMLVVDARAISRYLADGSQWAGPSEFLLFRGFGKLLCSLKKKRKASMYWFALIIEA